MIKKHKMFYNANGVIFENAKKLRSNMTSAESKLWERLSKSQLGVRFKPQHPILNFVADFYCHKARLVTELDGNIHFNEEKKFKDFMRDEESEKLGLKVIHFTNEEIFKNMEAL